MTLLSPDALRRLTGSGGSVLAELGLTDVDPDDCLWSVAVAGPPGGSGVAGNPGEIGGSGVAGVTVRCTVDGWRADGEFPAATGDDGARWVAGWGTTVEGDPAVVVVAVADAADAAGVGEGVRRVRLVDAPARVRVTDSAGLAELAAALCLRDVVDCLDVATRCVDLAYAGADGWGQGTQFAVSEVAMDVYLVGTLVRAATQRTGPALVHHALAARLLGVPAAERAVAAAIQAGGVVTGELAELASRVRRSAVFPATLHQTRTALGQEVHSGRLRETEPASTELADLRDLVRRFVTEVLLPHEARLNRDGDLPGQLWAELEGRGRELGLSALGVPAELGGAGLGLLGQLVAAEEMGRVAVGFRHIVGTPAGALPVARFGSADQRARYLVPWLRGERWGGWATTEPEAGSDLGAIRSTAVRTDTGWRISGTKHFVTGLDRADFVTTFVKTDPARGVRGLTAFLLDLDQPGMVVGARQEMMGREGLHSFELRYDNVEVPDSQRLGEVDGGFRLLIRDVNRMRVLMAGHCLGVAARLIDIAARWGRQRVQFGRPIGEFQALQWYLADSAAELLACRAATYDTAALVDAGEPAQAESATVKAYGTELAFRVADRAMQILGGTGYCRDMPVEALFRAVRVWRIAEGSSEIQRMLVGRQLAAGWRPRLPGGGAMTERGEVKPARHGGTARREVAS